VTGLQNFIRDGRHKVGLIGGEMFNATEENVARALDEGFLCCASAWMF